MDFLNSYREKIENTLEVLLPEEDSYPSTIHKSMRYSVFAGGKRLRGVLAILSAELFQVKEEVSLNLAAALECAHTYSLVHDDLPAMDDDDFRRGKPTNHKVFGEAIAILAGDALLTLAFQIISDLNISPEKKSSIVREFSLILGSLGMVGGQVVDIESEELEVDIPTLQFIHTHKTGALINFSIVSGAMVADNVSPQQFKSLNDFGERLGLAFQIVDDILDVTETKETMGKQGGQDTILKKATYISRYGLEDSRKQAQELIREAKEALASVFPSNCERLIEIADFFEQRTY